MKLIETRIESPYTVSENDENEELADLVGNEEPIEDEDEKRREFLKALNPEVKRAADALKESVKFLIEKKVNNF